MVLQQPYGPNHFYVHSYWTSKSQLRHIDDHINPCSLLNYWRQIHIGANYKMMVQMSVWYGAWGIGKGAALGFDML